MLRITNQYKEERIKSQFNTKDLKNEDIIIEKTIEIETVRDDGVKEISIKRQAVNLTKKINETARVYKRDKASEKLAEIEKIFSK